MTRSAQKLPPLEIIGYGAADAAANFVFMAMILFQTNFYTDVFGLTAGAAASIMLLARLWDAIADPMVGALADRTRTRWGTFRPWILFTAAPLCALMVLAYTTPRGWSEGAMIAYALVTNILLMSVYSMNNIPYAALGGVMTSDINERTRLNSVRFILVNVAQFVVGALTLPLVAKYSNGHDRQYGWHTTMTIWAVVCLILFLITFATSKERVQPPPRQRPDIWRDFGTLFRSSPWVVMILMTLLHFCLLSFRGAALYGYYHHYADKAAMYDFTRGLGLAAAPESGAMGWRGIIATLGYLVHGSAPNAADSNVADVFNSIINIINTVVTILVLPLSPVLSRRFGKKAVAVSCFSLATLGTFAFYLLAPTNVGGMVTLTALIALCYAPTIPLIWAIYADVVDYSEWKTGRRFTAVAFATVGFALKCGLALGSSSFLWLMIGLFGYDAKFPDAPAAVLGFRVSGSLVTGALFSLCAILLALYKLDKRMTLRMARELAERRTQLSPA
jgi:glycoside/pentoside/hexuronide:cation symporter, GPH family